ncbi:hydrogenobyrinic acid a,c-diamide synthase (glutamine-hydrolysing) [Hathewaya proteolytica DSM 3090]|uniref:Cobyrinate a,c-diamide synthase n=1 Tax=Hathewaya proteolytica DSM 3090 TaxID=1121331 RepID=A0A1M6Q4N9_9CLOT|nr:cobyrinate a,c-diamide synthase [Hathewaya proteolytica]SHK15229.1 hydrogenobyrinic acid a,c-diamide synthase (glutamine-hydrolysing) [Hathewaya proteolytica DSM 3090]
MKGIVVSSNSSGGGKTTVTLGLLKALGNRGYKVQPYKVGPDYIDSAFHTRITGNRCRNLDVFLMGEKGVKAAFSRGNGDLAVVEGVMGFYDGKGIDTDGSTYEISQMLDLPTVLVLSPKAQSATLSAEINGILNYKENSICGVILNNISSSYYQLLKTIIEKNCKLKVFGYIPASEELKLGSRHLGLIQSSEIDDLEEKIEVCAELMEKHVDLDSLMQCFKETKKYEDNFHLANKNLKIAVAMDKSFSFYYAENLELLRELGEVQYFSPIYDEKIPEDIDFLYIGGGYPEVFYHELSSNKSMINSIKKALEGGVRCYAECGGMMYLTKSIISLDGKGDEEELVAYFHGCSYMAKRLQNFGYATVNIDEENNILPKGLSINCHEFHKSYVDNKDKTIYKVEKVNYLGEKKSWKCGYVKNNTLGAYAHLHFFGNMEFVKAMFDIK